MKTLLITFVNIVLLANEMINCQATQAIKTANMVAYDELEIGRGANQVGTLQGARDT